MQYLQSCIYTKRDAKQCTIFFCVAKFFILDFFLDNYNCNVSCAVSVFASVAVRSV